MPELATLLRHCPSCGRRFEVRLLTKRLLEERKAVMEERLSEVDVVRGGEGRHYLSIDSSRPNVVDIRKFQFSYRCKHCGHQWREQRIRYT